MGGGGCPLQRLWWLWTCSEDKTFTVGEPHSGNWDISHFFSKPSRHCTLDNAPLNHVQKFKAEIHAASTLLTQG